VGGPEHAFVVGNVFFGPFPLDSYHGCIPYLCGELNGDGSLTSADGFLLLNYLGSGPAPVDSGSADLNGDDVLTPSDGYQLLNYFGSSGAGLACDEPCCLNCD
jgi:hypothetical protein